MRRNCIRLVAMADAESFIYPQEFVIINESLLYLKWMET